MKLAATAFLKPKKPDGSSGLTVDEALLVLRNTTCRHPAQQECLDVIERHIRNTQASQKTEASCHDISESAESRAS